VKILGEEKGRGFAEKRRKKNTSSTTMKGTPIGGKELDWEKGED